MSSLTINKTFPEVAFYSLDQIMLKSNSLRDWFEILKGEETVSAANISRSGLFANRKSEQMVESVEVPLVACRLFLSRFDMPSTHMIRLRLYKSQQIQISTKKQNNNVENRDVFVNCPAVGAQAMRPKSQITSKDVFQLM
jgi:hypothetical protein